MSTTGHPAPNATRVAGHGARWAVFAAATVTLYAGAAALVRSGLGADPFGAFISSFTRWGITPGMAVAIFAAAALGACWAAGARPRAGTIAAAAAGPILFDAFWVLLEPRSGPALFAAGLVALAGSAGILAATALGPGAPEHVVITAAARGVNLRWATWARDLAFVVVALAVGGAVGVGTLICAAAFSPLFSATYRRAAAALGTAAPALA